MTDLKLDDFIKFGEKNIVEAGYMVGGGWAKHAITIAKALRERLSQPESEPVAFFTGKGFVETDGLKNYVGFLYTAPPKREWVGLTDEEILEIPFLELVEGIQAKLKEKNT